MSILAADRKKIVQSDDFIEMIDELAAGVDSDLRDVAVQLKKWCYSGKWNSKHEDKEGMDYHRKKGKLYEEKLQTYDAVVKLIANYQMRYHGEKVVTDVKDWLSSQNILGSEFAMSGIPMRIFLRIAPKGFSGALPSFCLKSLRLKEPKIHMQRYSRKYGWLCNSYIY